MANDVMCVSYKLGEDEVKLDVDFVKRYLVRGDAKAVTDQELLMFMHTCSQQKLNPLINGEAYLIKYGTSPAQVIVGKNAYIRRAYENPNFLFKEDGITVKRGGQFIRKDGLCIYPGEELVGGWCRVHFLRGGAERTEFREVGLDEYSSGKSNWASKPATMIVKVAQSQALREAFPVEFNGTYEQDEMIAAGAIKIDKNGQIVDKPHEEEVVAEVVIGADKRKAMIALATTVYGKEKVNEFKGLLKEFGFNSTTDVTESAYEKIMERMNKLVEENTEDAPFVEVKEEQ